MKYFVILTAILYISSCIINIYNKSIHKTVDSRVSHDAERDLKIAFILWVFEYNNIPNPFNLSYVALYILYIVIVTIIVFISCTVINIYKRKHCL